MLNNKIFKSGATPSSAHVLKEEITEKDALKKHYTITDTQVLKKLYQDAVALPSHGQIKMKLRPKCIYEVIFQDKDGQQITRLRFVNHKLQTTDTSYFLPDSVESKEATKLLNLIITAIQE